MSDILTVGLGARSYPIHIGAGGMARAGEWLSAMLPGARLVVVTDETVAPYYLSPLGTSLIQAGLRVETITLPAGEGSKSLDVLGHLLSRLLDLQPDRRTVLVALGGGVMGDLVGFAASILLRGVRFVQIPTTLLAQVDSSVGGKTGINLPQGKNLVGSFHQPVAVIADTDTLMTLPDRQLRAGYAEVVKYGLINDPAFFVWLETHGAQVLARDAAALTHAVTVSCRAKAAIVAEDETEQGARALLNLGHTFAHALERATGFSERLLHGEAVAAGMVMAFALSERLGLCAAEDVARVREHLRRAGLPVTLREAGVTTDAATLVQWMRGDKKAMDGQLTFILARGIGQSFVAHSVAGDTVEALLQQAEVVG
jgi:3-dehydroquinate synthase